jgi:hypothetical protein
MPSFGRPEREVRTAVPYVERYDPERILVLNTSGFMMTIYIWDILIYHTNEWVDEWTLSSGNGVYSLEKTGDLSFIIYADRPGWLSNFFAKLFRTDKPLNPGDKFTTKAFTAEILEVDRAKNDALSVEFYLKYPLSDPGWLFLRWNGQAYEPMDLASLEIGQRVKLADTSDWLKSMM